MEPDVKFTHIKSISPNQVYIDFELHVEEKKPETPFTICPVSCKGVLWFMDSTISTTYLWRFNTNQDGSRQYTYNASFTLAFRLSLFTQLQNLRARPGFEPGTSRTRSANHTPRPTSRR